VDGGSGSCVEEEWRFAPVFTFLYASVEFSGDDAAHGIYGHGNDGRAAEAVELSCFFDTVVPVGGREDG
jgi:hypothetical protein